MEDFNNRMNQIDLIDIFRILHQTTTGYLFCPVSHKMWKGIIKTNGEINEIKVRKIHFKISIKPNLAT